jgi:hypothetical protein
MCAYEGEAFYERNPATEINNRMKVHLHMRSYQTAKLIYDENEDIVIGYSMSFYDFGEYPPQ